MVIHVWLYNPDLLLSLSNYNSPLIIYAPYVYVCIYVWHLIYVKSHEVNANKLFFVWCDLLGDISCQIEIEVSNFLVVMAFN